MRRLVWLYGLIGMPEPDGVAQIRAVLERPRPDGSTLLDRSVRDP